MTTTLTRLEQDRLEKIQRLRDQGIEPYPNRAERTHTSQGAVQAFLEAEKETDSSPVKAVLAGRLRSLRVMGKIIFAHIEDGDGRIQLFLRADEVGVEFLKLFKEAFDLGDFVQAEGTLFRTRSGEISLRVADLKMLAKAVTPLPAAKDEVIDGQTVRHAALAQPEVRYRQRYADLAVNPEVRQVFVRRAAVVRALRSFLDERGFLEVETPVLQPIYGGAAARPFTTHHNQLKQDLYLRISFELYLKRLTVGMLERVYEMGRDFRNEGVDRAHNPEFTMLEFYWAYADYQQVMALTEEMVCRTAEQVLGTALITYQGQDLDFSPPWRRIRLADAISETCGIDLAEHPTAESLRAAMQAREFPTDPQAGRGALIDKLLSSFVEPSLIQPTFLYDYPRDLSPLAKSVPGDPGTVERFEGFAAGMELCNAFSELNDPLEQEVRFLEMGRAGAGDEAAGHPVDRHPMDNHPLDDDYLRAMRYGMPPQGGFGMGIDRLVMLLTDSPNIREVILFPHLRKLD